jgi:effector-binding domain-containing protein
MVVDIKVKQVPGYRVASLIHYGPHGPNMFRTEFAYLVKWAKKNKLRTGKWVMRWIDEPGTNKPAKKIRSEACLEIKGKARMEGKIKIKTFPKQTVLSVTFDPEKVSTHLVYCGIYGWIRYSGFQATDSPPREVYTANPWTNSRAWANAEIQVPVKKR